MIPPRFILLITLPILFPISLVSALREVSGVLNVHHSLNLTRMHYHMRFWKEELSSLPASLAELPRLMLEHKRGELSMLTRTLLKEARLDSAIVTPVPDQTSLKVAVFFFLFLLYSVCTLCPPPPPPTHRSGEQRLRV